MRIDEFLSLADTHKVFPVYKEVLQDTETPIGLLSRVISYPYVFLLESVERGEYLGRYSFLGWVPRNVYEVYDNPFSLLRKTLTQGVSPFSHLPRFWGGLVGYISYDAIRCLERIPFSAEKEKIDLPLGMFIRPDFIVAFDHVKNKMTAITDVMIDGNEANVYNSAEEKLSFALDILNLPRREMNNFDARNNNDIERCIPKETFEEMVKSAVEYIKMGEAFQIVLSQRFLFDSSGIDPLQLYRALRFINPSPYMFFLKFNDTYIIGSSPEVLVRVEDRMVEVRPIAGTRGRDADPQRDKELEEELLCNEKEQAEHIMLVDLGRNDVGKVSVSGSIRVDKLMEVERYSHVMHMVSSIKGRLKPELDCVSALEASFPAGTVSGAPKVRAMEIIEELEPFNRGPYAGGVGYVTPNGDMDTCIAIRSAFIRGKAGYTQAGAGIVYDSVPEAEYYETINKSRAMFEALKLAGRVR
ncbi:MAG TPA: anthranilate synthase component I family protein [Thermoanaerobacterium sp.]|nr:anthranilate synthase component I family protein [Thermoanaerobacterium sp.]